MIDSSVERDVKFGGVIRGLPLNTDPTNRTDLLRIIDNAKRDGHLLCAPRSEIRATFYLDIHSIKLYARTNKENLLLRIAIPEVASVSYIRDDELHLLVIIYGEVDLVKRRTLDTDTQCCNTAVLYCDSRGVAEELCSLVDQCFQTVYTEATMHFFDRNLMEVAAGQISGGSDFSFPSSMSSSNSTPSSVRRDDSVSAIPGFLSQSSIGLGGYNHGETMHTLHPTTPHMGTTVGRAHSPSKGQMETRSGPVRRSNDGTVVHSTVRRASGTDLRDCGDGLSEEANKLILDYMDKLYTKLTQEELLRFSVLVKSWHTDMSCQQFCQHVSQLYGPHRAHLLVGMRPFIPAKDSAYFERFLEKMKLQSNPSDHAPNTDSRVLGMTTTRERRGSQQHISGVNGGGVSSKKGATVGSDSDEYDEMLTKIEKDFNQLRHDIQHS